MNRIYKLYCSTKWSLFYNLRIDGQLRLYVVGLIHQLHLIGKVRDAFFKILANCRAEFMSALESLHVWIKLLAVRYQKYRAAGKCLEFVARMLASGS